MYILQTRPGQEDSAKTYLKKKGYKAIIPKSTRLERRRGKWIEKKRQLFTSYIFLDKEELSEEDYYTIKGCSFIYRFLDCENKPYKLTTQEVEFINTINSLDEVITLDKIELFGFIEINGLRLQVMYIEKRKKRAKFRVLITGEPHIITLSFRLKDELNAKELIQSSEGINSDIEENEPD